ncbi:hypothetical protein [Catelliglobosispora koreensis]|uniref:hypothetical protein n=1 Tax=Catelliglobosispora koreensis TaxID=129052 RepID=UPI000372CDEA|nr:hypothetical protein [Catelliglobosispora koreensis]
MLTITRPSAWRSQYEIHSRGRLLATWKKETWKAGGEIVIGQQSYVVRSSVWGNKHTLIDQGGGELALADRVGRKRWTIASGAHLYQFQRASLWRADQQLLINGQPKGYIRRASGWRFGAEAELSALPLPVQIFAVAVVLSLWEQAAAASGA